MNQKILISLLIGLLMLFSGALYFYSKNNQADQSIINTNLESRQNEESQKTEKTTEQTYEDIKTQYENSGHSNNNVPLPLEKDIINLFFHLINEGRIPEAINIMSKNMIYDDNVKQAWGVQFNDIKSVKVQDIMVSDEQNWLQNEHKYKVVLEIYVSSNSANAPIPYYGWGDNPNIRWITIIKEDGLWKINEIATGP